MKNRLFILTLILSSIISLNAQDSSRWNNLVLKGFVATKDTILTETGAKQEIVKPLEGAAVMLFKSLDQAQGFKNKFDGMTNTLDSIRSFRDSAGNVWAGKTGLSQLKAKFRSFLKMSKSSASAVSINSGIDILEQKLMLKDSSFFDSWSALFKQVNSIYSTDFQQISGITKYGTETDESGKYYIMANQDDKQELKYILCGLMGYHFTLNEISPALADTIILKEKIFRLQKVEVTVEGDAPFQPVYISKNFSFSPKHPTNDDFDVTPFLLMKSLPIDLSVSFGDYCWYYTYNSGAYVGNKTKQFFQFVFGKEEKTTEKDAKK